MEALYTLQTRQSYSNNQVSVSEMATAITETVNTGDMRIVSNLCVSPENLDALIKATRYLPIKIDKNPMGGCYGARTGDSFNGFDIKYDAWEMPAVICEGDDTWDIVQNPCALIDSHGIDVVEVDEGTAFEMFDALVESGDFNCTHGNTCNDENDLAFEINFRAIGPKDGYGYNVVLAEFHYGGDTRGNYSRAVLLKGEPEDIFNVLFPSPLDEDTKMFESICKDFGIDLAKETA